MRLVYLSILCYLYEKKKYTFYECTYTLFLFHKEKNYVHCRQPRDGRLQNSIQNKTDFARIIFQTAVSK